jgi:hypothetical protein
MKDNDRESLKEKLLIGIEPSPELQERFTRELDNIIRRRLSKIEVVRNVLLSVVFILMAIVFACIVFFAASIKDEGLSHGARILICLGFAGGSLVFLAGAVYAIAELRSGHVAPRRNQQGMIGISASFILLLAIGYMGFGGRFNIPLDRTIQAGIYLLFFWVMAVGFVVKYTIQWYHEDLLVEQKRTQLEIALLREEIAKNSEKHG